MSHAGSGSNLPLLPSHLLARTLDFGMIDTPVSINWDGDPVKRVVDGINNDKDV